jgi:hypothetical protein
MKVIDNQEIPVPVQTIQSANMLFVQKEYRFRVPQGPWIGSPGSLKLLVTKPIGVKTTFSYVVFGYMLKTSSITCIFH